MTHANLGRSTVAGIQWEEQAMDNLFVDVLGGETGYYATTLWGSE